MRHALAAIPLLLFALAAAAAQAAPINDFATPIVTRQAVFSIPFTVPALSAGQQPAEVRLLASGDRGGTWQVSDRIDLRAQRFPYKGGFTFRAAADGEYWFAIRTADQNGQMPSSTIGAPELRVVVDTRPPRLDLTATRGTSGEVVVRWQVVDPNLKPDSLRLDYQSTGNPRWQSIAMDSPVVDAGRSSMSSSATCWPADAAGVVTIKAEVSDLAGNTGVSQAKLDLQQNVQPFRRAGDDRPPLTASMNRPSQPGDRTGDSVNRGSQAPDLEPTFSRATQWPADARTDLPLGRGMSGAAQSPASHAVIEARAAPMRANQGDIAPLDGPALGPSADGSIRPSGQALDRQRQAPDAAGSNANAPTRAPIARSTESPVYPPVGNQYVPAGTSRTASNFQYTLPPGEHLRMVNSTTFELGYDVDSIGRSGIAKVELWATRDGGRTWTSMGVDSDNRSPFVTTAEGEGVYGYRITVQSGSGLGGRPPQPGDLPELWIGVDLTRPAARLVSAEPGTGERVGEIVIRYEANDALLASKPVTLLQSAQPGGPWTTIAAGLDHGGQYAWRFDNSVPDRVYLRLEVRDEAGNIGTFEAADPISLERVLPQGRLRSVRPVGDSARGGPAAAYWQR